MGLKPPQRNQRWNDPMPGSGLALPDYSYTLECGHVETRVLDRRLPATQRAPMPVGATMHCWTCRVRMPIVEREPLPPVT